ncbi:ribonuclease activity regulator RraA [Blastococcus sp. VKM Ac-2987]|uniref:ribonuclease activity regulator RraA n=1 Tax=Blastococcus sp. VKM Ac-2987 TaxID=3004141 RepID=UPI0022ABB07C|nr:ribonuclease activity regulator RraA [Blastococcus sp. VKM Ac-2987]MCZ2856926.1 ribonuclease activity regulator RraA [Blastococcus sp. VKM Ac-2987]
MALSPAPVPEQSEQVPDAVLDVLREVSTATLTTQLMARGLRNTFLGGPRPLRPGGPRMVGPAFTLRYIPAREDIDVLAVFQDYDHPQRLAVESVPRGAVLVIDSRGQTRAASLGEILATRLFRRGVAGVVTDGSVRDAAGIAAVDMPTFAAGASPTTNLVQHHAVDLQVPIGCGEVAVYPGDIMVGDDDGVVCLPRSLAAEVAEAAAEQERLEEFVLSRVDGGAPLRGTYPPDESTRADYQRWVAGRSGPARTGAGR